MNNERETVVNNADKPYSKTTRVGKTKKGKFNIVDFILVIMVLAVVAAAVIYFAPDLFNAGAEETDITFTIEFRGVDSAFITNIKNGDAVYDSSKHYMLGSVKSVENYAYTVLVYNEETGTAEAKEVEGLKNIVVTVTAKAIYTDGKGYFINGERIAVGCAYNISFPEYSGTAYCIEVSVSAN